MLLSRLDAAIPSTRVSVVNVLPFLREAGFETSIAFEPDAPTERPDLSECAERIRAAGFDIVYFQKVHGPSVLSLVAALRSDGVRCVYGVCDHVNDSMVAACDATVVITDYLKSLHATELQSRIHVVHDGIERPEVFKVAYRADRGSWWRPLRAVLVTSTAPWHLPGLQSLPAWLSVEVVGAFPPNSDWVARLKLRYWQFRAHRTWRDRWNLLRWIANPRISCVRWDPDDVYRRMLAADIGIIPVGTSVGTDPKAVWRLKSENRLTLMMSLGLPVVATPIPAYETVVEQGRNGYLANDRREWLSALRWLRDPVARRDCGQRARDDVAHVFSTERQAALLAGILRSLVGGADRDLG